MRKVIGWGILLCLAFPAWGAQEPRWEAGAGLGVTSIPDYRGADEGHTYVFPIPYFVYRSDKLKIDRDGVHRDLARSDGAVLDFSAAISPPAKSKDNTARQGMDDIKPSFEIGPSLKWLMYESPRQDVVLFAHLPVRAVMTTGFEYIGWVSSPHLNLDVLNLGPSGGWNFGFAIGPLYGDERYHDYYYEVKPEFATATRPAYDAKGGYSGSRVTLSLSKRFSKIWFGSFVRYDDLHGAAFIDSPLIRKDHSLMAGFGISYIFAQSEEMVEVDDPFNRR